MLIQNNHMFDIGPFEIVQRLPKERKQDVFVKYHAPQKEYFLIVLEKLGNVKFLR